MTQTLARAGGSSPLLTRIVHEIEEVRLGDRTVFDGGLLTVSPDQARESFADPALEDVRFTWASPGDSVRIIKVLDVVEPRSKGPGGGGVFPGWVGPPRPQGRGQTHVLRGAAIVAAGWLPRAQEGLIDMSGPAAELSPFGATHNLVVEFEPSSGADWADVDRALRRGMLRLGARLGETALDATPSSVEELHPPGRASGLPRIAAITNLQTQGAFKDVFVYGRSFSAALPTLIDPGEFDDGTVVSGQYGHPALRNPTYVHQNHPVVSALRRRDGHDLSFAGVVISPEPVEQSAKELVSEHAARVCAAAGFDAVVVTKEGGGNADADMALKMDALAAYGIESVGLFAEMAGSEGTAPPIEVAPTQASAMVSTGNYDQRLELPAVERALGGQRIDLLDCRATDEVELPTAVVLAALSPLGFGRLRAREAVAA